MSMHYAIRLVVGVLVLASLALGSWVSPYWFRLTGFVGLNLIQSAFSHWCLMEKILLKLKLVVPAEAPPGAPARVSIERRTRKRSRVGAGVGKVRPAPSIGERET